MSWTKRDTIVKTFSKAGLSSNGRNLTPDELQDAMEQLDTMMAGWTEDGIIFDPVYPQPTTMTGGNITDKTNAPLYANEAMYLNLALAIASDFGKVLAPEVNGKADIEYNKLIARSTTIPEKSLQGMLRGAGAKHPLNPFFGDTTTTTT